MKLKIEPSKLKDMLTTGLIAGQLSNITTIITPTAISFQDLSLGTLGVYAIYTKDFFPAGGFENQNESVTITKYLLDVLNKGFKNDEQIELYTEHQRGKDPSHAPPRGRGAPRRDSRFASSRGIPDPPVIIHRPNYFDLLFYTIPSNGVCFRGQGRIIFPAPVIE
jgi:hypothetical protein